MQILELNPCYLRVNINKLSLRTLEFVIEYKRGQLKDLVAKFGNFTHPNVVRLSQQIDEYMVQLQKIKMNRNLTDKKIQR
ncbi:aspartyl-phosphate phosphatase Spo0E family protein [Fodinisporobacter ferrooxydans]|uniref:Aspartyl-phosphate phosphatase Spo0E family protein n=1 Tax=Fodinisporobacter ferrooxydans TaxID=2901836 RepID=A0ABY4CQC3_9BACL|nr:aspartyl-phosphate phosphatase Spo0E family protein [Alicyclobacillaceae bacterium MYW30-H2]